MKKIINILLCIIWTLSLVSCNNTKEEFTSRMNKERNTETADTIVSKLKVHLGQAVFKEIKGDLNEYGSYSDNGGYFLHNLKIENVKDYKYIAINADIQNDGVSSVNLFRAGWQCTLPDGTELNDIKINEIGECTEIDSNSSLSINILIPVERKLNITEINLKYEDKNYSSLSSSLIEETKVDKDNIDGIGYIEFNNIKISN